MTPVIDIHTHRLDAGPQAIISVEPRHFTPVPDQLYSVGHHPWNGIPASLDTLAQAASHPQVVAVGETGIDGLRGASVAEQEQLFANHISLAQELGKPVIAHMVRTSQQLVRVWQRMSPSGIPLIVHGMRGNANVARTLLDAGFHLSYGEHFNPDALRATPPDRILAETDESTLPIASIIARMALELNMPTSQLNDIIACNTAALIAH